MLIDPREIEIISQARQKNIRDHTRSREHFNNIFKDFFCWIDFKSISVIDLGPGQYDFGLLAMERGAMQVAAIDNDPAVLELGRYRNYTVVDARLQDLKLDWFKEPFDLVFCKFAINCFWFWDAEAQLRDHIDYVASLVKAGGYSWIAPWNGVPKSIELSSVQVDKVLSIQREAFLKNGFEVIELTDKQAVRYGVTGAVANHALFTKNLSISVDIASRTCAI
jgi:hypothetical protein